MFEVIATRLASRNAEISYFTATRYSFEEWLNWEAFAACAAITGWQAKPKPRYCDLGVSDCKDFGDLSVTERGSVVLVEVGLVHDGTHDKWRDKLDWDVQKLARPLNNVQSLHVVVLVSDSNIETSDTWQRWLGKVPCWGRPDALEAKCPLASQGQMMIRGWTSAA